MGVFVGVWGGGTFISFVFRIRGVFFEFRGVGVFEVF